MRARLVLITFPRHIAIILIGVHVFKLIVNGILVRIILFKPGILANTSYTFTWILVNFQII